MHKRTLIVQKWEESERGWGTRPDGYSLHLSQQALAAYVDDYWARMPNETPDEYSRPSGTPYSWEADEKTYDEVAASKNGIRSFSNKTPGSGGRDGWVSLVR